VALRRDSDHWEAFQRLSRLAAMSAKMSLSCLWTTASALVVAVCTLMLLGCTSTKGTVRTGVFVDTTVLENRLIRGVSTKSDVQISLGTPKGRGGALLPAVPGADEVWLYDDIQMMGLKKEGEIYQANLRQQVLLVFFKENRFDGFMWYSMGREDPGQ
jgi:hypothetical protein